MNGNESNSFVNKDLPSANQRECFFEGHFDEVLWLSISEVRVKCDTILMLNPNFIFIFQGFVLDA